MKNNTKIPKYHWKKLLHENNSLLDFQIETLAYPNKILHTHSNFLYKRKL